MTDKLKARIEEEIAKMSDFFESADDIYTAQSVIDEENVHLRMMLALLFAVEGHGAVEYEGRSICSACSTTNVPTVMRIITPYPCAELKGISERFGVEL
jgi:hypothetical protein